jgi:hypothetical protein
MVHLYINTQKVVSHVTSDAAAANVTLIDIAPLIADGYTTAEGIITTDITAFFQSADTSCGYRPTSGWKWTLGGTPDPLLLTGSISAGVTGEDDSALNATLAVSGTNLQATLTGKAATDISWTIRCQLYMHAAQ